LADDSAVTLLAIVAAIPAKDIILPPPVIADKATPFQTRFF
jgi:hypothetical protein